MWSRCMQSRQEEKGTVDREQDGKEKSRVDREYNEEQKEGTDKDHGGGDRKMEQMAERRVQQIKERHGVDGELD